MKLSQNVKKADQEKNTFNDPMSFHMKFNGTSGFFLVYTKTWTGYFAYRKDHPGPLVASHLVCGLGMVGGIGRGSNGPISKRRRRRGSGRKRWKGGVSRGRRNDRRIWTNGSQ